MTPRIGGVRSLDVNTRPRSLPDRDIDAVADRAERDSAHRSYMGGHAEGGGALRRA